ncbi:hypothetical protein SAMN05444166_7324 [Singulisphaera sp. GP187]|nr:hypothetical protein SAMN05444166_7324 [Singulisphaera sp. GP187]
MTPGSSPARTLPNCMNTRPWQGIISPGGCLNERYSATVTGLIAGSISLTFLGAELRDGDRQTHHSTVTTARRDRLVSPVPQCRFRRRAERKRSPRLRGHRPPPSPRKAVVVISSPMRRAIESAILVARACHLSLTIEPALHKSRSVPCAASPTTPPRVPGSGLSAAGSSATSITPPRGRVLPRLTKPSSAVVKKTSILVMLVYQN